MVIPTFTSDWFTSSARDKRMVIPTFTSVLGDGSWLTHVAPRLANIRSVRWLEVGSHEGRSALWTAANLLRGDAARIVCVDPWLVGWNDQAGLLFDRNTEDDARIIKLRGRSVDVLPLLRDRSFHGAYVDGLHDADSVLHDARKASRLLAPGGIVIFDDYGAKDPTWGVKPAVDMFLGEMRGRIDVVYVGWQLIAQLRGELS
jgi:hypothetical protein